jgi:hypothetical protein
MPVHHFFLRHVYTASRGHASRPVATVITFLISAFAHELVMGCITKKLRGYGFVAMMLQMPIVMVQRSRWVRGRTLLNVSLPLPSFAADPLECALLGVYDNGIGYGKNQTTLSPPTDRHRCAPFMFSYRFAAMLDV